VEDCNWEAGLRESQHSMQALQDQAQVWIGVVGVIPPEREFVEFEDVRPMSPTDEATEKILSIAAKLEESKDPKHVRYATFHTFPRVM
jgi:hypothetical protein